MEYQTIKVDERSGSKIITVTENRIYLGVTDIFREEVLDLLQKENIAKIIINLEQVAVMNSAGLGVLIMARAEMNKKGGEIKLTNLQPLMQDIISRMRLDTLFKIFNTVEEAVD